MKKIIIMVVALLLIFTVSCSPEVESDAEPTPMPMSETIPETTPEPPPAIADEPVEVYVELEPELLNLGELHSAMLYDFDYFIQLLRDTFQYFGVVERKFGLDVEVLISETREKIINYPYSMKDFAAEIGMAFEDMPPMDERTLWSIITYEFLARFMSDYCYAPIAHLVIGRSRAGMAQEAREGIESKMIHFIYRTDLESTEPVGYDVAELLTLEIIEENRIAYINLTSFSNHNIRRYIPLLNDFYRNIQDFEHLIIDIRESGGGMPDIGYEYFMQPLWYDWENTAGNPLFVFFRDPEFAFSPFRRGGMIGHLRTIWQREANLRPIDEILQEFPMSLRNMSDFEDFTYGLKIRTELSASIGLPEMDRTPFAGEIWLLTSRFNSSSSAIFAHHARDMGFATLVGETVGGAITAMGMTSFTLPNSGLTTLWDIDYITDHYGRSLVEFPTEPHYFNRDGLDALETVLQMIAERG